MASVNVTITDSTVCLTGPESAGKTSLAEALGEHFAVPVVREVAREYLDGRNGYAAEDLLEIARLQVVHERAMRDRYRGLLICDTDLLVIAIWWQEKFGALPEELETALQARTSRVYLLTKPDLAWEADPLRENPTDRDRLFERYRAELDASGFGYAVVEGAGEDRLRSALDALERLNVL